MQSTGIEDPTRAARESGPAKHVQFEAHALWYVAVTAIGRMDS